MTQGADGRNREAGFRVAGLYDAPGTALEKSYAFTGIRPLQKLLGTNDVTEVSIRLRDDRFSAAANRALVKEMDGLEVLNWRQLDPQAAAFYEIADVGITIWYVILLLRWRSVDQFADHSRAGSGCANSACCVRSECDRGRWWFKWSSRAVLIVAFALAGGDRVGIGLVGYFADGIDCELRPAPNSRGCAAGWCRI
jgi:hypothetical protein